jgi:ATP-dependent helicase Lhr and Lhr-like helicase
VAEWFRQSFAVPTPPQAQGWPAIARAQSTLILAPTGSGKTLTAFLWCINRLMFDAAPDRDRRCRVLYISPLKALAVDIERNLRAPLTGIANRAAARGDRYHLPAIAVRTGDTPAVERARFQRDPSDILITTPESLYLLLTSNARDALRAVDTVIVDEIHALVPTKRGAHLSLSLERLEAIRPTGAPPLQRIGLSATQRPLDEVARFLGGARSISAVSPPASSLLTPDSCLLSPASYRAVSIVDTSQKKRLDLTIEVPVEDMARIGQVEDLPSGPAAQGPVRTTIWTAIHPRLLELIRAHRSTLIFVNSRRIAERLASAINELAGETLVRSHHGSVARPQRIEVEDRLKAGLLQGLVATSSLELGIDMGAIDLVIQIEAPPSVASGMQRIGRSGHTIDEASRGIIVPKFRGDLVACAAVTRAMHEAQIESTRYPRNPLDVLAQQIVAMVSMDQWSVDALFDAVRRAAPFAQLGRGTFEGVLDMLSGRYPSDDFADLRPRLTWDRIENVLTARAGAKRIAVTNGGTIPDRGLYGVFLAGVHGPGARVGELDEEMVFESRVGETFLLGASTWRIEQISHDRVLVSAAPGEPGKMPFWKADVAGRPLELGRAVGQLVRTLVAMPPPAAIERLVRHHDLDAQAAENLLRYLADQIAAAGVVPDDQTVVIERRRDEMGDWRVCVLSPFGSRIHAPWAMAVTERVRAEKGLDVETMWTDDGFVVRFPETDEPPDSRLLLPASEEVEALVLNQLGGTALFAARFREAAGRALLLPKRRPGGRSPLWQLRKRSADLLAVASRFASFPIVLETYRECLRDVFDMPALVETLGRMERREIRVATVDSTVASPFAAALLFGYVANYLYDGDAPLAERRAQALSIDQAQLRELLGDIELRELLDADAMAAAESELQQLQEDRRARTVDGVHDLLLRLGDLSVDEVDARAQLDGRRAVHELAGARRAIAVTLAGQTRIIPVEYANRYRDALGVPLPTGLPDSLLEPAPHAALDLVRRYARTHGPFTSAELAARYGLGRSTADALLRELAASGRLLEGDFRPGGTGSEWCDPDVLQTIRRRSLAKLRHQVEPVEPATLGRLVTHWQGVVRRRGGLDALLDAIEGLQGAPIIASILETEILPARVEGYLPSDLDALTTAGEVVWGGLEPLGERDGRLALYLTDHVAKLRRPPALVDLPARERAILDHLEQNGASFFATLHEAAGGGYPGETVDAIWTLVWAGLITNDSLHAVRAFTRPAPGARARRAVAERARATALSRREREARAASARGWGPERGDQSGHPESMDRSRERLASTQLQRSFRSRRMAPPTAEGRWSLMAARSGAKVSATESATALAQQLLARYGVLTREVASAENIAGGFSAVYDVLKALEDAGRIRRGYFASGVGATQFALPAALDLLRSLKELPDEAEVVVLSATDPANPYGTILRWPALPSSDDRSRTTRTAGSLVVIVNGALAAYISRGARQLLAFLPDDEPGLSTTARAIATTLARLGLLVHEINGLPATEHPLAPYLVDAGFSPSAMGFQIRRGGFGLGA